MAPVQALAALVLGRLSDRARPSPGPAAPGQEPGPAECWLGDHRDLTLAVVGEAVRHAWLALEIALAGQPVWTHVGDSLPPAQVNVFRQQMDALLDLLGLAG